MTKRNVRSALGFTKDVQLAAFFRVGKTAVCQWDEDELIPVGKQWMACSLRPDLFGTDPEEHEVAGS